MRWDEQADVIVVGYGGAGAVAAITAHDAGVRVLLLEKQAADTPTKTQHTPNSRMSGGGWLAPTDIQKTALYLQSMIGASNETLDPEREEMILVFARYLVETTGWLKKLGVRLGGMDSLSTTLKALMRTDTEIGQEGVPLSDFDTLPGSETCRICFPQTEGKYRHGAALFKSLLEAVQKRGIAVMWETPAVHLVVERGEIRGVIARRGGKNIAIKATRGVVLTCGGFEFNNWMKENYLRVNPSHFYGNPGNTGDGIIMAQEIGASFWHMNCCSWRVIMKFPDFPIAFATQGHATASIFVDRRGKRFTNERFKLHTLGYELTNYDSHGLCYPKVPCYWIFDEKRRGLSPLASIQGPCNPPGGIMGDVYYMWSDDNQKEIERGWIIKASTLDDLASKMRADQDNGELMSGSVLQATVKQYNEYCRRGEDADFHKPKDFLQPIEDPPYYAVKLLPGGPNTQGGPRRNVRGQIVRPDNTPIPRLYCAGELGSVWSMLYQSGGNIAECVAFGRICGANVAAEKPWV